MQSFGVSLDWDGVSQAAREHRLLPFLKEHVSHVQWASARTQRGVSLLHYAAELGDAAALVALILQGVDVNASDDDGLTPAHFANWAGDSRLLQLLIAAGANVFVVDANGESPLDHAVNFEHIECVSVLLDNGARLELVRKHFASFITSSMRAHENGIVKCCRVVAALLGIKRRRGPVLCEFDKFLVQVMARDIWLTRGQKAWQPALEDDQVGPCVCDSSPTHVIDWGGAVEGAARELRLLPFLEKHVSCDQWTSVRDHEGWSLLHYATRHGDEVALVALLCQGADVNTAACPSEWTPTHVAAKYGLTRVLQLLLAAGASISTTDFGGIKPLDYAVDYQRINCVRVLVSNGARLERVHEDYKLHITPLMRSYEDGVLTCRGLVVVLLGIKRRRGPILSCHDKFVIFMVAHDIWMTRGHQQWQNQLK